jgi:GNAT superfamily N-acetyltransferase
MRVAGTLLIAMLRIRPATIDDVPSLRTMIREFADFEHELHNVTITEDALARDGFDAAPRFRTLFAEWDGQIAGYALFFETYSTWVGAGLFLEDIYVREQFRGKGIGKALLAEVASIAVEESCYGVSWEVLDWNQNAIDLYKAVGAEFRTKWKVLVLSGEAMHRLADKAAKSTREADQRQS